MSSTTIIAMIGAFTIFGYGLSKLLDFYGIGINVYGSYMAFYTFIFISAFVLPRKYPHISINSKKKI